MTPAKRLLLWAAALGDHILAPRCPFCRERTRYLGAHQAIDHFGETK